MAILAASAWMAPFGAGALATKGSWGHWVHLRRAPRAWGPTRRYESMQTRVWVGLTRAPLTPRAGFGVGVVTLVGSWATARRAGARNPRKSIGSDTGQQWRLVSSTRAASASKAPFGAGAAASSGRSRTARARSWRHQLGLATMKDGGSTSPPVHSTAAASTRREPCFAGGEIAKGKSASLGPGQKCNQLSLRKACAGRTLVAVEVTRAASGRTAAYGAGAAAMTANSARMGMKQPNPFGLGKTRIGSRWPLVLTIRARSRLLVSCFAGGAATPGHWVSEPCGRRRRQRLWRATAG